MTQNEHKALKNKEIINQIAQSLNFDFCGISKSAFLEKEASYLDNWLKNKRQGTMQWMENHFDKRLNPSLLFPGTKSIISLLYNYYPEKELPDDQFYRISKYAYGTDYHTVIKDKLKTFIQEITLKIGKVEARAFVDSAPVMDKVWAQKSGLGWIGKHTNLINRNIGSFFFIAEILVDLELTPDGPIDDYCGTCTKCVDACPTDALSNYEIDANKCISYLTIELKEAIPDQFKYKMDNWIFGCDICQDVCPWNRFSKPTQELQFQPISLLLKFTKNDWEEITEQTFKELFAKSAIKRTKLEGLKRNIRFVKGN
ncbi:MAG: tRNA epoxyqueuosine(34) reductase QueG [Bacteroidota bacterium]|nr:tRNA epoxyqueuosine(34) reductase QueG [Bacteroidota bacterium]